MALAASLGTSIAAKALADVTDTQAVWRTLKPNGRHTVLLPTRFASLEASSWLQMHKKLPIGLKPSTKLDYGCWRWRTTHGY
mmetsp:Transcript_59515/g.169254  ORF Transcript_59515/g.169254 Transcript_59515/m.169254 type:complete len:82 (-) Transcript_59515:303-548(-)